MRLFRKSKAAEPAVQDAAMVQELVDERSPFLQYAPCPAPAPALELSLQLPSFASGSMVFDKSMLASNASPGAIPQQQQSVSGNALPSAILNYEITAIAHPDSQQQLPERASSQTILSAIEKRRGGGGTGPGAGASSAYNFDYPQQYVEMFDKPEPQEKTVQSLLHEQYSKTLSVAKNHPHNSVPSVGASQKYDNGKSSVHTANLQRPTNQFSRQPASSPSHYEAQAQVHVQSQATKPRHIPKGGGTLVEYIQAQQDIVDSKRALFAAKVNEQKAAASQKLDPPSSNDDSSAASSENGEAVQKLSGSMAAMSIGKNGAAGGKDKESSSASNALAERALHIQRVREACAQGKVVTFNSQQVAAVDGDSDDENDSIPLGGLKRTGGACVPDNANNSVSSAAAGVGLCHAQGMSQNRSLVSEGHPGAANYNSQVPMQGGFAMGQQAFHHQYNHMAVSSLATSSMPHMTSTSLSAGARTPVPDCSVSGSGTNSSALAGINGFPVQLGGPMHQYPYQGMHSMSMAQMQQMASYQRGMPVGGPRVSMVNNASAQFGNGGYYRGSMGGPPDGISPVRPVYTPSPLGQMPPVYAQQGNVAGQAQMAVPDVRLAAAHVHGFPRHGQCATAVSAHTLHPGIQQPQQQMPPPYVGNNAQKASLTSFIPSQPINRGAFTRNPLMRDLNKIKEFSAKDYTARPTLLAEVDSRMLAKKNIPGLGGSASHSYQPPPLPRQQQMDHHQQQQPMPTTLHRQMNSSELSCADRKPDCYNQDYHYRRYASSHRFDHGYEKSMSCQNLYGMCDDDASMSSSGGSSGHHHHHRNIDAHNRRRGSDVRENRRYHHNDPRGNAYGRRHGENMSIHEFRRVEARSPSRGYRSLGRHYRKRRDDYYYEQYDYDDTSDTYASDCYDELDEEDMEYEKYHERGYAEPPSRHRKPSVHRTPHGKQRSDRRKMHHQTRPPPPPAPRHHRGEEPAEYRGGPKRRPPMYLDDPRGNNGLAFRTATGDSTERRSSIGSQSQSSLVSVSQAKPRSQFGRMLANIKRQSGNGAQAESKAATDVDVPGTDVNDKEPPVSDIPQDNALNSPVASVGVGPSTPDSQANSPVCTPASPAPAPAATAATPVVAA